MLPVRVLLVLGIGAASIASLAPACSKTGVRCASDFDCDKHQACVFAIGDGCSAMATCQDLPETSVTNGTYWCGCEGHDVDVDGEDPVGYAPAPVAGPKRGTCGYASPAVKDASPPPCPDDVCSGDDTTDAPGDVPAG